MKDLELEYLPVASLVPYAGNPKAHPRDQIRRLAESIKEFGFIDPVLVDKDNVLVAGHGRILAAKRARVRRVPVLRVEHLTPAQVKRFRIQDNRLAELGHWDAGVLLEEFAGLELEGVNPDDMGFDAQALKALGASDFDEEDEVEGDEPKGKGKSDRKLSKARITYEIVFETDAQQQQWYAFMRYLKLTQQGDTIGGRLAAFCEGFLGETGG